MNVLSFVEGFLYLFFFQSSKEPVPISSTMKPVTEPVLKATSTEITNADLAEIAHKLSSSDTNGVGRQIKLNLQGHTQFGATIDKAPSTLFATVPSDVLNRPTYSTFLKLLDNYEAAAHHRETVTSSEVSEEEEFLREIFRTDVIRITHEFLASRGLVDRDIAKFKLFFKQMWFGLYPRIGGIEGSSGFEHVFVGELKNGIIGFHSWIRFLQEEKSGFADYLGFIYTTDIGNSTLLKMPMKWRGEYKPLNTILIGSSPELELALYTICFLARPDALCPLEIKGKPLKIQTHTTNYHGKRFIGTAYPAN